MAFAAPDPAPSGQPLPVTAVNGQVPQVLDDFVGQAVFTLQWGGSDHLIAGQGSSDGDVVRFHEKDAGHGKDVRVWVLVRSPETGQFTACTA